MVLHAGQTVYLRDAQQRHLGQVVVEHRTDGLITGTFYPGPDYAAVERLFRAFEEAVNCQALAVVDGIDAAIAALGLQLCSPDSSDRLVVHDVQIWSDGGFSCRAGSSTAATVDGSQVATRPTQPAPE